ncbi:MAG: D-alanyl-D-alanine carboxypeptidase family protein [Candidatus Paracaedibacteraceae bacterium]|nr:D-alanyl-D-alanine carboxypeptidase family protein [Candidatus Paracaedibacteraceae bacterium]
MIAFFTSFLLTPPSEATPKNSAKTAKAHTTQAAPIQPATATPATTPYVGLPLDIEILAREAYMVDYDTGAILLEKDATKLMHPSSMTKIMTAYLVVDKIKTGVISRDTIFTVSKNGWRVEGSSMFLNINDQVKVDDLLKGLIIQSGNDSSVILAENISGSEAAFAKEMTRRAHEMGATQTNFLNASGLPLPNHMTTAKDLAIISTYVIKDQPEFYGMYSEKEFTYGNIKQGNRNPLLSKNMGCDGIKTGHSQIAGYGVVASCVQDGKRLILVINGLKNMNERSQEAQKLITWGFRTFINKTVATSQQIVGKTKVSFGTIDEVQLIAPKAFVVTIPKAFETDMKVTYDIPESINAPITRGAVIGKATVTCGALKEPIIFDLVANINVEKAGFIKRIGQKIASIFDKK